MLLSILIVKKPESGNLTPFTCLLFLLWLNLNSHSSTIALPGLVQFILWTFAHSMGKFLCCCYRITMVMVMAQIGKSSEDSNCLLWANQNIRCVYGTGKDGHVDSRWMSWRESVGFLFEFKFPLHIKQINDFCTVSREWCATVFSPAETNLYGYSSVHSLRWISNQYSEKEFIHAEFTFSHNIPLPEATNILLNLST